jgi:hypothetical protein
LDDDLVQELDEIERMELEQIRRNIHEERKVAENLLFRFSNENILPRPDPVVDSESSYQSREEQQINIIQYIIRDGNIIEDDQQSCGTVLSDIPLENVQSIGNQTEEKLSEYNCFEDCQLYVKII